jgi:hypothetical protein
VKQPVKEDAEGGGEVASEGASGGGKVG